MLYSQRILLFNSHVCCLSFFAAAGAGSATTKGADAGTATASNTSLGASTSSLVVIQS